MADLRKLLHAHGIRPRKKLGQNFLTDAGRIDEVITAADVQPGDTVVEVGPGLGTLTTRLADRAKRVIALELDQGIIPALTEATKDYTNLEIRHEDVLKTDTGLLPRPYKVIANVPYYITSKILEHFLAGDNKPDTMTVTIQKEVAERVVAGPPKMSVLAISVQLYGNPQIAAQIPRQAFWPVPEVDSAVLRITDIGKNLSQVLGDVTEAEFFSTVRAGFAEKRKQLHNTLARNAGVSHEDAVEVLRQEGIMPTRRAETLTIPEWVSVTRALKALGSNKAPLSTKRQRGINRTL